MKIENNIQALLRENFTSLYQFTKLFIKSYLIQIFLCIFCFTVSLFFSGVVVNILLEDLIDNLQNNNKLILIFFSLIGVYVCCEIFTYFGKIICSRILPSIEKRIRISVFDYVQSFKMIYFQNNNPGAVENIIDNLSEGIKEALDDVIIDGLPSIFFIITSTIYLFFIDSIVGFIFCISMLIYFSLFYFFADKFIQAGQTAFQACNDRTGIMVELFQNIKLTKMMDLHKYILKKIFKISNEERFFLTQYYKKFANLGFILGIWLVILDFLLIAFILFVRSSSYNSPGICIKMINLFFVITYNLWTTSKQAIDILFNISRANQSMQKIYQIPKNEQIHIGKKIGISDIEVKNLNISFDNNEIIKNFSISIPKGSKFCLIGCSGVGKSTFLNAITKLIDIPNSQIFVDNKDINEVCLDDFKSKISYISQTNYMFHASILENIIIGKKDATFEDVVEICKKVKMHDFISNLSNGYKTMVGANSLTLSGGQIQRICIARALLNCGDLVICDEPVSALDFINGKEVVRNILELTSDKTVLWVDHFSNIAKILKNVIFFDSKKKIHVDTHENLMKTHSEYPNFFHLD